MKLGNTEKIAKKRAKTDAHTGLLCSANLPIATPLTAIVCASREGTQRRTASRSVPLAHSVQMESRSASHVGASTADHAIQPQENAS